MNFDFLKQNFKDNTLNEFTYKSPFRNIESYNDFKTILNNGKYGPIRKEEPYRPFELKYNGYLHFDHGNYNNIPETHKYYNLNRYITPSYRDYEIGNKKGPLTKLFEKESYRKYR